jgi:hypothetical protein
VSIFSFSGCYPPPGDPAIPVVIEVNRNVPAVIVIGLCLSKPRGPAIAMCLSKLRRHDLSEVLAGEVSEESL